MPHLICLDVGTVRIGVATADTKIRIAVPYETIAVDGNEIPSIAAIARKYNTRLVVVGLPRNASGEETAQSRLVRAFALRLRQAGFKIAFEDESLTSVIAENRLKKKKKRYTREEVDKEAATIILQSFLDTHGAGIKPEDTAIPSPQPTAKTDVKPAKKPAKTKSPRKEQKPVKKSKLGLILAIITPLVIIAIIICGAFVWYKSAIKPHTASCPEIEPSPCARDFIVEEGDTVSLVAQNLEDAEIIRSALAFQIFAKLNRRGSSIKPGQYTLMTNYSLATIIDVLERGVTDDNTFRITFIPGKTLRDIRKTFRDLGYTDRQIEDGFTEALASGHPFIAELGTPTSLEGLIFPETLEFYKGTKVSDIIIATFDEYIKFVTENDLINLYRRQNLTLYEGIVLASIVQREGTAYDMPGVAQVFLSRLIYKIPLGSDATIGYGADLINPDRDKSDMSYLQTLPCPYNTRKCVGLPPTPIATPGLTALNSVAHPADTDYLFFLHDDAGNTHWARTDAEHEQNKRLYCGKACTQL